MMQYNYYSLSAQMLPSSASSQLFYSMHFKIVLQFYTSSWHCDVGQTVFFPTIMMGEASRN